MAVVGHVEWVDLLRVSGLPGPGDVVSATETCEFVGGSGAIAALQLAKLRCDVTFYTRLSGDALGARARAELELQGVRVEAVESGASLRRAIVHVDASGERTITVWGEKRVPSHLDPLPWNTLADMDGVCFLAGDTEALRIARRAGVLVATARWLDVLGEAGVQLDALVGSGSDPAEAYVVGDLLPQPKLVVVTDGDRGGSLLYADGRRERYEPVTPGKPMNDAYGCGDSFLGGLALALSRGDPPTDAIGFAARCGAACFTGRGLAGQLRA